MFLLVPEAGILNLTDSVDLVGFEDETSPRSSSPARKHAGVSSPAQTKTDCVNSLVFVLCRRRDLNPHPLRDTILSRARIPIPPLRQYKILYVFHTKNSTIEKQAARKQPV